ncbi:hypothetical protein I0C86_37195 [Plantactinospora sp. S1510]|uniref:PH domain-containing protein n=1 Tax=Plantactinospora alkalitolerans TaxID=2789879 RepID=A0ABS0H7S3_9ACTN|nr:hypothetical protein [Plantactinospora alkalitolerans]MBF9134525.1 hypothetical protein [Plantactinospora alkalitolerans]
MTTTGPAKTRTRVLPLLRKAAAYEVTTWRSLYRWIRRRPVAPEGATAFSYAGVVTPLLIVFIVVSAIEIPILDLILPWKTARIIAAAVGVYGLLWMIGLLASLRVHPHVLGDAGIRIRNAASIDVTLPWDAVETVRKRYRSLESSRAVQVDRTGATIVLNIGTASQTSVDIVLRRPMVVPVRKGADEPVHEVRCYADDPEGFVARARQHLTAGLPDRVAG